MAEVDKLTLEVEDKASKSTQGIDDLVNKLQKLDNELGVVTPKLQRLSNTFTKLQTSANGLRNINFNNLGNSMKKLSDNFSSIERSTSNFESTSKSIRNVSSAMSSLYRSYNKLTTSQSAMGQLDFSGILSQSENISKFGDMANSLSKIKEASSSINKLVKSFDKVNALDFDKTKKSLEELVQLLKKFKEATDGLEDTTSNIKQMSSALNSLTKAVDKLSSAQTSKNLDLSKMNFQINKVNTSVPQASTKSLFGGSADLLAGLYTYKQIGNAIGSLITSANDYIETMNLFTVVMGKSTQRAWEFVSALESIGVNQEQAMRFQASFYDIGKSLGMTSQNAYTLSEQFTKLAYDYASLYNMSEEDTFQKLQAAMVGTVEPIRRLGKDISEAKLQEIAYGLAIEKKVSDMTQAEKAELRFIAVMQQSKSAMNDMERTINQPANAFRILRAQVTSLGRELGSFFIPIITKVLPYLIAITKFIRGLVQSIASFFGITLGTIDWNGINSQLGTSDDYTDNIANNLGDASDNAKKLKDYMLGIDELNVLNPDTGTTKKDTGAAGAGSGGTLGFDLEDFGYDEVLKQVQDKADKILKTLEKWKVPLLAAAGILATLWGIGKINNFIKALKGVNETTGVLAGVRGLGGLASAFFNLAGSGGVLGTVATAFVSLGDTILSFIGITTGSVTLAGLVGLGAVLGGVALATWGVINAMKPAVSQVNEFKGVSDETREKLEGLVDTWKSLETEITKLDWTDKVITDEDINSVTSKVNSMVESVLNEVDADRNQELQDIEMLQGIEGISEDTYNEMIASVNGYYDNIMNTTTSAQEEIQSILQTASSERRTLKSDEVTRLQELERQIRDNAVETMSESEEEQTKIMTRLNHNLEALTIESGSNIIKEAKANYKQQVQDAEDWRDQMIANLDKRFDTEESRNSQAYQDQYNAIMTAYDNQVQEAEDGYNRINQKVRDGLGDQSKYIDDSTGNIRSRWSVFWSTTGNTVKDTWDRMKNNVRTGLDNIKTRMGEGMEVVKGIWNSRWATLRVVGDNAISSVGSFFQNIWNNVVSWFRNIGREWTRFWNNPIGYVGGVIGRAGRTLMSNLGLQSMGMGQPVVEGSEGGGQVYAFARGGFVPSNARFVSPSQNIWTAGEAGRELVGNYQGRTTVMPLEDTGFVQAIYQATREAVVSAMNEVNSDRSSDVRVYLDSREIRSANVKQENIQSNSFITRK